MKNTRVTLALVGFGLLCIVGLFPPRKAQLPELAHLPVSRAFLFSKEAYLYRGPDRTLRVEIDTGRMLSEVVLVVAFIGSLLVLTPPAPGSGDR